VTEGAGLPEYDVLLDERGRLCPLPVIALGRAAAAEPSPARILLLADDPAAETDVPAWCSLRGRTLAWAGPAPDHHGRAYLVTVTDNPPPTEVLDL
jgi:TusA-related sulfurtransferase